jgi:hypothetical protein
MFRVLHCTPQKIRKMIVAFLIKGQGSSIVRLPLEIWILAKQAGSTWVIGLLQLRQSFHLLPHGDLEQFATTLSIPKRLRFSLEASLSMEHVY